MPNPASPATSSTARSVASNRRRACRTRWPSSHCSGVVPVSARKRRAKVRSLRRPRGAPSRATVSGSRRRSAVHARVAARPRSPAAGSGRLDELRLAAVAMRRHDDPPCDRVGHLGAVVASHEVQAEIDARRNAGRGQDVALVDVEDLGIDGDRRVVGGQLARHGPSASWPGGRRAGRRARGRTRPVQIDATRAPRAWAARRASSTAGGGGHRAGAQPGDEHRVGLGDRVEAALDGSEKPVVVAHAPGRAPRMTVKA